MTVHTPERNRWGTACMVLFSAGTILMFVFATELASGAARITLVAIALTLIIAASVCAAMLGKIDMRERERRWARDAVDSFDQQSRPR